MDSYRGLNFLTFRDLTQSGGGAVRILGILNSVAKNNGLNINLFSNNSDYNFFDKIEKHDIAIEFTPFEKKLFQFLLSFLPLFLVNVIFRKKLDALENISKKYDLKNKEVIFFEYLDLSVGYFLKKNGLVRDYICDIHGIVPSEFKQKKNNKIYNTIRYLSALNLDKKVFKKSKGFIFASQSMRDYFNENYPTTVGKKYIILPYLISVDATKNLVDSELLHSLRSKFKISDNDNVIFFAGGFKYLGGIVDLVSAFSIVRDKLNGTKLFLIGDGEEYETVRKIIEVESLQDIVIQVKKIPYSHLRTYQELATVIVCPDKQNLYSNMILHLKYIDSLLSGKIVINGRFNAVCEINKNECLSVNFEPSNITDLANKIIYCIENKEFLESKYKGNIQYVKDNMLYESEKQALYKFISKGLNK